VSNQPSDASTTAATQEPIAAEQAGQKLDALVNSSDLLSLMGGSFLLGSFVTIFLLLILEIIRCLRHGQEDD
jgi:hypothetical protein